MEGFIIDIEKTSEENKNFRKVLYTAKFSQLVVMRLKPGEEIGMEVHEQDQFIRVESGQGKSVLQGREQGIQSGFAVLIPAGTKHNIINSADSEMKLYTLYSPPHHKDGTVHATKRDAENSEESFDGETTENLG